MGKRPCSGASGKILRGSVRAFVILALVLVIPACQDLQTDGDETAQAAEVADSSTTLTVAATTTLESTTTTTAPPTTAPPTTAGPAPTEPAPPEPAHDTDDGDDGDGADPGDADGADDTTGTTLITDVSLLLQVFALTTTTTLREGDTYSFDESDDGHSRTIRLGDRVEIDIHFTPEMRITRVDWSNTAPSMLVAIRGGSGSEHGIYTHATKTYEARATGNVGIMALIYREDGTFADMWQMVFEITE
jgi:hypothetical protein